jgi:O-methyltransferase involved in polyketide biosynthesis
MVGVWRTLAQGEVQGRLSVDELKAALTACGTSLFRATHTRIDPDPIFVDPWGDKLVPVEALEVFRQRAVDRLRALGTDYADKAGAHRCTKGVLGKS